MTDLARFLQMFRDFGEEVEVAKATDGTTNVDLSDGMCHVWYVFDASGKYKSYHVRDH